MLWDIIYMFFVQYIFGGYDSNLEYHSGFIALDGYDNPIGTADIYYNVGQIIDADTGELVPFMLSLGNWLSTISTIIVFIGICWFFWLFVKYMFKAGAGLFKW